MKIQLFRLPYNHIGIKSRYQGKVQRIVVDTSTDTLREENV